MAIDKETILKMPPLQKALIIVGLILLLGIVWYYLLYTPNDKKINALNADLKKINDRIAELERAKKLIKNLEAEIAKLEKEITALRTQLPEDKEIPALLSEVTEKGRINGLTFSLFKQNPAVKQSYFSEIPVQITVQGDYHQVALFLYAIGTMDRIMHASDLKMGSFKVNKDGFGSMTVSMKASTYTYIPQPVSTDQSKSAGKGKKR